MEPLIDRVKNTLCNKFPSSHVELELIGPQGRIFGTIASPDFDGLEQTERQSKVWSVLDSAFTKEELLNVFGVLTFIPEEATADVDF